MRSKYWLGDQLPKTAHFFKALLFLALMYLGEQLLQVVWLIIGGIVTGLPTNALATAAVSYPWSLLVLLLLWVALFIYLLDKAGLPLFQKPVIDKSRVFQLALGFLIVMAVQTIGSWLLTQFYPEQLVPLNEQLLNDAMQSMTFPRMFLAFCVLAPIQEEIMMRGLIMRYMFPKYPWVGMFVSAFIFASLHLTDLWVHFFIYFGMGFGLAFIYYKTGRLEYSIAGHSLNNFISVMSSFM
ncbi:MAG: CPBP family intramembrane metalloprotease [Aerococcus sp.]|nr:CPBP family intramembrane metalloprotease [Aerococcus sp.]